jgi:hypothetical protein
LDDLIRAVENLGHSVSTRSSPIALVINGEQVPLVISETFVRNEVPPDADETMRPKSYELEYPEHAQLMEFSNGWIHRPSGKLTIVLGEVPERGLQRIWTDHASHRVESRIGEVAAGVIAYAQAITSRRERIEQRPTKRPESGERRQQDDMDSERQGKRVAFLRERAGMFEEAERTDRFLQHVRHTENCASVRMSEFLKWSDAYIAALREKCSTLADELATSELW